MAWGGERGVVVVDVSRRVVVAALGAHALYHPDPRAAPAPAPAPAPHLPPVRGERQRSPSLDQVPRTALQYTTLHYMTILIAVRYCAEYTH